MMDPASVDDKGEPVAEATPPAETAPTDLLDDNAQPPPSAATTTTDDEHKDVDFVDDDQDEELKNRTAQQQQEEGVEVGTGMDVDDDEFEPTPFEDVGDFDKEDIEEDEWVDEDDEEDEEEPLAKDDKTSSKKKRLIWKMKKKSKKKKEPKPLSDAEKRRRRRALCLLICCCLLIIIILILIFVLVFGNKEEPPPVEDDDDDGFMDDFFGFGNDLVDDSIQTTPLDPYVKGDCDFSDNIQPHVISQCQCDGRITIVAEDIRNLHAHLKEKLMPELYREFGGYNVPITSCDPKNQALIWLSSGDTRRAGDLVQRYLTAMAFISMNGTKWDYQNLWLSDHNECMWYGLQCNKRYQVHSVALDTMNIFGNVRKTARTYLFVTFVL